jgi:hypothetical protein
LNYPKQQIKYSTHFETKISAEKIFVEEFKRMLSFFKLLEAFILFVTFSLVTIGSIILYVFKTFLIMFEFVMKPAIFLMHWPLQWLLDLSVELLKTTSLWLYAAGAKCVETRNEAD